MTEKHSCDHNVEDEDVRKPASALTLSCRSPDPEHAVNVVPDGSAQHTGVHILVRCHGVVGQVVGHLELLVQHLTNIGIQSVDQREAMILPAIILENSLKE